MKELRLLFDENLSPRLVKLLAESFPNSLHVDDVGLRGCSDGDVWSYARERGFVLVSKDNDFRQLSFLRGAPPKVVWLRIGNAPTKAVVDLLCSRKEDVESFVRDTETALLAIQMERDYP
jgi:predicted nuclease of predicted toxin-antitoxin system